MKFKFKQVAVLSAVALSTLAVASCKDKGRQYVDYTNTDTSLSVSSEGTKFSLGNVSAADKEEVLGLLEKYAVENNLTGITLFEDSGFQMFDAGVKLGTETYITGYGFGTLREGNITAPLRGAAPGQEYYYHTYESEDPGNLNYMDDKGSVVGNLVEYNNAGYFTTKMNSAKTGYEWIGDLSKQDRPDAVDADSSGKASKFRFEVKVGDDLVYNTATTNSTLSKYKGRKVALEDYLTPYKLKWSQKIGYARAAEGLTDSTAIKGASTYYSMSKNGIDDDAFDEYVGIKAVTEGGKSYLEFEFNVATTPFMAMYYLTSSMYAPVPLDFIKDLGNGDIYSGAAAWGKKTDAGLSPVDTVLTTGNYVPTTWENDKEIVFKKNELIDTGETYQIPGIHIAILKAITTDTEAALKEFLAGKLSACGIPSTKLNEYKNDSRTRVVKGSSNFKLNVNSCDQATWEKLFGVNGSITQTPQSEYWDLEPAMSNKDFLLGLSYSINRAEFAENRGKTASVDYFSSNYLIDPENGISYNSTETHKNAVASLTSNGTNLSGYSLTAAQTYFKRAAEKLIADGKYKTGDKITIEIAWQTEGNITTYGNDIKSYFETAFNNAGTGLTLEVTNMAVTTWSDVYYKKMMVGQFDLGFGSISGNSYDPLNFLEVLKSDNTSGFTLNWGTDTNTPAIEYKGKTYSFDALWQAADTSCTIDSTGARIPSGAYVDGCLVSSTHNDDNTRTIVYNAKFTNNTTLDVFSEIEGFYGYYTTTEGTEEFAVDFTTTENADGTVTYTIVVPEEVETIADSIIVQAQYVLYSSAHLDASGKRISNSGDYSIVDQFNVQVIE